MVRCLVLVLGAGCAASEPAYLTLEGRGLGTTWTVVVRPPEDGGVEGLDEVVVAALAEVDAGMSTWRDDSDLARVRAADGPVAVSAETAEVVREALALAARTGGAFDPTVQPLVELWGLMGTPRTSWPTDEALAGARAQVGWTRVTVDLEAGTVDAGGTALDLSAIAKGHAVDRVVHALTDEGVIDLFVEVGGEVRAHGRSPRGEAWRVGIEAPVPGRDKGAALVATVPLVHAAFATSGNYRTAYVVDGRTIHHTLDPRTGLPAASRVLSSSVRAPDGRTADGWATALMVLGPEEGLPLVEALPDVEAWLLVEDEAGRRVVATPGLATAVTLVDGAP